MEHVLSLQCRLAKPCGAQWRQQHGPSSPTLCVRAALAEGSNSALKMKSLLAANMKDPRDKLQTQMQDKPALNQPGPANAGRQTEHATIHIVNCEHTAPQRPEHAIALQLSP